MIYRIFHIVKSDIFEYKIRFKLNPQKPRQKRVNLLKVKELINAFPLNGEYYC